MKFYNAKFIKDFIEKNKDNIKSVTCGMLSDWFYTAMIIYEYGEYASEFIENISEDTNTVFIMGINGSRWDTPLMNVEYIEGQDDNIECYWSFEPEEDALWLKNQKEQNGIYNVY